MELTDNVIKETRIIIPERFTSITKISEYPLHPKINTISSSKVEKGNYTNKKY